MPRRRSTTGGNTATIEEGETSNMSDTVVDTSDLFETLDADEWKEQGGGGSAERGLYSLVLTSFAASGKRYATISMEKGRFAGKKASSVATALKNTRDGKNPPEGVQTLKITSKGENAEKGIKGLVFLENTAVEV
jgi:hypothetical protein